MLSNERQRTLKGLWIEHEHSLKLSECIGLTRNLRLKLGPCTVNLRLHLLGGHLPTDFGAVSQTSIGAVFWLRHLPSTSIRVLFRRNKKEEQEKRQGRRRCLFLRECERAMTVLSPTACPTSTIPQMFRAGNPLARPCWPALQALGKLTHAARAPLWH